jgi:hypothetical protein
LMAEGAFEGSTGELLRRPPCSPYAVPDSVFVLAARSAPPAPSERGFPRVQPQRRRSGGTCWSWYTKTTFPTWERLSRRLSGTGRLPGRRPAPPRRVERLEAHGGRRTERPGSPGRRGPRRGRFPRRANAPRRRPGRRRTTLEDPAAIRARSGSIPPVRRPSSEGVVKGRRTRTPARPSIGGNA